MAQRILVVEDEGATRTAIVAGLKARMRAAQIDGVGTVQEALERIDRAAAEGAPYDQAILDLHLPQTQAGETTIVDEETCARVHARNLRARVVHMTGHWNNPDVIRHLEQCHQGDLGTTYTFVEKKDTGDEPWAEKVIRIVQTPLPVRDREPVWRDTRLGLGPRILVVNPAGAFEEAVRPELERNVFEARVEAVRTGEEAVSKLAGAHRDPFSIVIRGPEYPLQDGPADGSNLGLCDTLNERHPDTLVVHVVASKNAGEFFTHLETCHQGAAGAASAYFLSDDPELHRKLMQLVRTHLAGRLVEEAYREAFGGRRDEGTEPIFARPRSGTIVLAHLRSMVTDYWPDLDDQRRKLIRSRFEIEEEGNTVRGLRIRL